MDKKSNFEKVKDFNRKFNLYHQDEPTLPHPDNMDHIDLGIDILCEEYDEVVHELDDLVEVIDTESQDQWPGLRNRVAKELADLLYVTYGMADRLGIPLDEVFEEVHRSNMSKLDKDGNPIYNSAGKLLKGCGYSPADMNKIFRK